MALALSFLKLPVDIYPPVAVLYCLAASFYYIQTDKERTDLNLKEFLFFSCAVTL